MLVAFGPEKDTPSWNWVGFDLSTEMSNYFNVKVFGQDGPVPSCDVAVIIKQPLSDSELRNLKRRGTKIIYCPIDYFNSPQHIQESRRFLTDCDLLVTHCERLTTYFKKYRDVRTIEYLDHNCKYTLPEMAEYKEDGYVLWVGGCQYVPYLLQWLRNNYIDREIKILTDLSCDRAVRAAYDTAKGRVDIKIRDGKINEYYAYNWTERTQFEMLQEAKAAIDIKATQNFNQQMKPPTKAQKYVTSGIPFAVNSDSYSAHYFRTIGFNIASPTETMRWFSKQYYNETQKFGDVLKQSISLESIGLKFKRFIDKITVKEQ